MTCGIALLLLNVIPSSAAAQAHGGAARERVVVSISPQHAAIPTEGSQQFTATVRGATNEAVIWTVNGVVGETRLLEQFRQLVSTPHLLSGRAHVSKFRPHH